MLASTTEHRIVVTFRMPLTGYVMMIGRVLTLLIVDSRIKLKNVDTLSF